MYKEVIKIGKDEKKYVHIFTSALFLSFHYYLITYINSTFLSGFVPGSLVGLLYSAGAVINILIVLRMPKITKRFSLYDTLLFISVVEIIFLLILAFAVSKTLILVTYILHHAITPLALLCLNVTIEDQTKPEKLGRMRASFLTLLSSAAVVCPLLVGSIIAGGESIRSIYIFSAFFMFLFFISIWKTFKKIPNGEYKEIDIPKEFGEFMADKNIRKIGLAGFMLQFLFSWLIIFVPIFLQKYVGLSWGDIGLLISITLLPFLLLEIPVGEIADRKTGEKEFLISGFIISALALCLFPFIKSGSFALWTTIIFMVRVGASIVETSVEGYFYKKSKGRDELISIFSLGSPTAYILGPLVGSVALKYVSMEYMFPLLGILLLIGVYPLFEIEDTK